MTQFKLSQRVFVVVSHQDITERKLTEIRYQRLAHCDALTGLANRRQLNAYLTAHWSRLATQDAHM
ncbi:MAG: GGDEF domain-containing protein [Gammaproteobacteria bacterium]|nr:GGDEF domain-containing protein [Gammaproteobacteria bacterium]